MGEQGPDRTFRPDATAPTVYGVHQAGIASAPLAHALLVAYDVDPGTDLRALLAAWTAEAERLMRAGSTTVTIGIGPTLFDDRFGLAKWRPAALRELPAFAGDVLDPALCGGDLCVLVTADAPPGDLGFEGGRPRWEQRGARGPGTNPRGAIGFRDGTLNLRRPRDLERHVWVSGRERSWMLGGTFLVVRVIEVLDTWRRLAPPEQERVIGRERRSGAPLGGRREYDPPDLDALPPDSHIRLAAPRANAGATFLRRGYDTEDGLLFLAYQRDPRRQFVPVQRRLAEHDALHPHTRAVGSAVFAVVPGARQRECLAHALLYAQ